MMYIFHFRDVLYKLTHQKPIVRCGFFSIINTAECVKWAFGISRCFKRSVYNAIARHFKNNLKRNFCHIVAY